MSPVGLRRPKRTRCGGSQDLFVDKVDELTTRNQLTSGYVNMTQMIMKKQHSTIGGLFCVTLGGSLEYPKVDEEKWMQIVHNGNIPGC